MGLVQTNDGLRAALNAQIQFLGGLWCELFVNDHTPSQSDLYTDYVYASFPGYAGQQLAGWSLPYLNSSAQAEVAAQLVAFTQASLASPVQTVYGYVVRDSSLRVLAAERTEPLGYPMSVAPLTYRVRVVKTESNP